MISTKSNVKKTNPIQTQFKAKQTQLAQIPKMNVTSVTTTDYEEKQPSGRRKNKPNSNPISPPSPLGLLQLFAGDVIRRKLCFVNV